MKLGYTIIYVQDVLETVSFYEKALTLKKKFIHESQNYAEMETGTTTLGFASLEMAESSGLTIRPNRVDLPSAGFELAFMTKDVEKSFQWAVSQGAHAVCTPVKKPWGQVVGYIKDINGILIELCSEISSS